MKNLIFLYALFFFILNAFQASPLKPESVDLDSHPPRIIRTCCMFGFRVGVFGIPFLRLSAITSMEKMGQHHFLGGSSENNGVVYTRRGGFIDMGHLRDNADWTAWLYSLLEANRGDTLIERDLGYEEVKTTRIFLPTEISDRICCCWQAGLLMTWRYGTRLPPGTGSPLCRWFLNNIPVFRSRIPIPIFRESFWAWKLFATTCLTMRP